MPRSFPDLERLVFLFLFIKNRVEEPDVWAGGLLPCRCETCVCFAFLSRCFLLVGTECKELGDDAQQTERGTGGVWRGLSTCCFGDVLEVRSTQKLKT